MGLVAATTLGWSVEPLPLALLALMASLYAVRARSLRRHGRPVSRTRAASFALGLVVVALALVSPVDTLGEERLFSVHMLQHVLIGDLAPLLVVLGLDGPLLRPMLVVRRLRSLRVLASPLVALPVWAVDLCVWHVPALYDAALRDAAVHSLQHALLFACACLLWAALLEPVPGPTWFSAGWKLAYVGTSWLVSLALAQVFLWSQTAYYAPYVAAPRTWGLSALADQRAGGGVMLVESSLMMLGVAVWLLGRVLSESEARQLLVERGAEPAAAARAARYGRRVA